jgi:hypothetical protein
VDKLGLRIPRWLTIHVRPFWDNFAPRFYLQQFHFWVNLKARWRPSSTFWHLLVVFDRRHCHMKQPVKVGVSDCQRHSVTSKYLRNFKVIMKREKTGIYW